MTTKVKSSVIDTVANTQITGLITSGQIATVANTQITGLILPEQISVNMVRSVLVTSPITNSGTNTEPNINIQAASSSQNGYMSSTYASKLDGIASGATNVTNNNQLTNGAGYITSSSLSGYATQSYVTSQGYITSSGLSGYATLAGTNTWSNKQTFSLAIDTAGIGITARDTGINFTYLPGCSITGDNITGVAIQYNYGTIASFYSNRFVVETDNAYKPSGGQWLASSDRRLKENITNYTKGLNDINTLRTVNFNFTGKLGQQTNKKTITGLIAQDVLQTNFANIVGTSPDGMYNIDSSELMYALVNAVQELSAEVKALKAKLPN
jgi:hypothetical protein